MKDEIWVRVWNDGHDRFSADLDDGFARLGAAMRRWRASASEVAGDTRIAARRGVGAKREA